MNQSTVIIIAIFVMAFAVYRVLTRPETGAFGRYEKEERC